ncbi:hypothetical protein KIM67_09915 [Flagellimonas sp. 389]|uniref:hypothetical protein n=1 Tax=Flagellimonas sp. 389 TaxID=2835862 RepID=UPI001BD3696C|nr:hypothetical protein [Flagellimonas sp. 389]MBS9462728.1 hypothetical protein [Flagellimonas sp. 389]
MKILRIDKVLLIGLSLTSFISCGVTEMNPPDKIYLDNYLNNSSSNVRLELENLDGKVVNSIEIQMGQQLSLLSSLGLGFNGGEKPIQSYVDDLVNTGNVIIKLYVDEDLRVEWTLLSGDLEESIKSPFNYNSWKLELFEPPFNNDIVGKIVFTITDEDIGD